MLKLKIITFLNQFNASSSLHQFSVYFKYLEQLHFYIFSLNRKRCQVSLDGWINFIHSPSGRRALFFLSPNVSILHSPRLIRPIKTAPQMKATRVAAANQELDDSCDTRKTCPSLVSARGCCSRGAGAPGPNKSIPAGRRRHPLQRAERART